MERRRPASGAQTGTIARRGPATERLRGEIDLRGDLSRRRARVQRAAEPSMEPGYRVIPTRNSRIVKLVIAETRTNIPP